MSLLMDALRKAEEAKRRTGGDDAPPAVPAAASMRSRLPDLSLHADAVDADLAAVSSEAPARRPAPPAHARAADARHGELAERSAARNVFAAKEPRQSHAALWLIVGLGTLAALGLGGYFWWQLQAVSSGVGMRAQAPAPVPVTQASLPGAPLPALPIAETAKPVPTVQMAPRAAAASVSPDEPIAAPAPRPLITRKPAPSAAPAAADNAPRLARSQPKPNQTLENAYDALQAGQLDEAQRGYELALRGDAKNTDALLGLATIAVRRGQADAAQTFYLRALEADPNDATAQAGLINLRGQADPDAAESRLKTALAGQPESAVLYFALGNVYAREQRWSEAQQAYFRAYGNEPDNADIIFNLAVSLDHLHQNKLAAQYYQKALVAAGAGSPSFDKSQVKTRLLELQP